MGWLNRVVKEAGDRLTTPAGSDTGPSDLVEQRPQVLMLQEGRLHPVVGEASHQKALHRLAGRLGTDGPSESRRWHIADLVPEPTNPHDPNAIAVTVGGQRVGYIARDRTQLYHPFLRWAREGGWIGVSCRSRIMGGFKTDDGHAHLGIELDHTLPPLVRYDGPPPTIADPEAGRINLVGEERHQAFLEARLHRRVHASLVVDGDDVHAHVDGTRIGSLTKKMAERYGSLLDAERRRSGAHPTCICVVEWGANKIEAQLLLPTGQSLAAWRKDLGNIEPAPTTAPADWYPDPYGQHRLRYFDGAAWTGHTAD